MAAKAGTLRALLLGVQMPQKAEQGSERIKHGMTT